MTDINIALKCLIADLLSRAKPQTAPCELEALIDEVVPKLILAFRVQDRLLTEREVARRWKFLTVKQLQHMRYRHKGPKYLKFGKARNSRVYYRISAVEAWIVEHEQLEPYIENRVLPRAKMAR